ncbi:hypothetical protein MKW98_003103 [Papaver atlanticum]|uniref:Uncharacterized protein n=1 Tax=Papaver atlanticum TaxID=357466 RepID=A0AAD4TEU2_9MAGN|nr:hypothetical protein MKW98_003103 [Papaver atlanticum]
MVLSEISFDEFVCIQYHNKSSSLTWQVPCRWYLLMQNRDENYSNLIFEHMVLLQMLAENEKLVFKSRADNNGAYNHPTMKILPFNSLKFLGSIDIAVYENVVYVETNSNDDEFIGEGCASPTIFIRASFSKDSSFSKHRSGRSRVLFTASANPGKEIVKRVVMLIPRK